MWENIEDNSFRWGWCKILKYTPKSGVYGYKNSN